MATVALSAITTPGASSSAAPTEEEIAKKKNTDCVYFLASPLTCKKGEDCEFRHSESARLNPRDCWYWVGGNCLNRDCPFRHPPLEARATAAPPAPSPHAAKKPVPCFYFSQGYCVKGAKCQFLHGQKDDSNGGSNAMVYRLADSAKPGVSASDSARPTSDTREGSIERRKENVYRLQDDPRKGKLKEEAADPSTTPTHKKQSNFTWKLSENTPTKAGGAAAQVKPSKRTTTTKGNAGQGQSPSGNAGQGQSPSGNSGQGQGFSGNAEEGQGVDEEFASPKSLAQIREEKRGAGEEFHVKGKRKHGDGVEGEYSRRRRLSNGTSDHQFEREASFEGNNNSNVGHHLQAGGGGFDDEEEDDFAQKLGGLFS